MHNRRQFIQLGTAGVTLGLSSFCASSIGSPDDRPNVLFIFPDQMRAQAMGCMGNPDVRTPNLDRLASGGILFRHTLANTPVCCPARANILTGKYAHRNGMVANDLRLRESEVTLAELLAGQGYRTGFIGKWHLDGGKRLPGFVPPGPRRQGFQFWAANQCSHSHFDTQYFRDSDEPLPIKKFEPESWTDLAVEFMRETRDQPFFLMVAMGPPHNPYKAPEKYGQMYDAERLKMRPNWKEGIKDGSREDIAAYYGAITAIDDQIGRLMQTLDNLGMAENTIVLFSSDHGDMLGSHGLRLKRKPWEESISVPGILRYPRKVNAGRGEDTLFTHVDIAPTLLGLCQVEVPSAMQGSDLSPVVLGETKEGPDSAFFQIFGPYQAGGIERAWRGVRTQRYVYARYESEPWVLYDLEEDPYQLKNLAHNPAAASLRLSMEEKLNVWMEKTGDSWSLNWIHPVEDKGRLYRYATFHTVEEYLNWASEHPQLAPKD